ncbi:MAG: (d)CMP kinase [Anaerolineales bacterium]|nr:(d)CMP kinase [Anaerolineales bacterium]
MITIDGPAASGKSTLGKNLADWLDYLYFDTGVMYRAVTWAALHAGISMDDEAAVSALSETIDIDVLPPTQDDGRAYDVLADGQDITWDIRRAEVDGGVSVVAAYPGVRKALTAQQRRIGLRGKVVMVGRDIGTVVLPEADLKIYLEASVAERARRRFNEIKNRGGQASMDAIRENLMERDRIDSTRDVAPLCAAPDAIILDSDQMDANRVLEAAKKLVKKHQE